MKEDLKKIGNSIVDQFNPLDVDWSNKTEILKYGLFLAFVFVVFIAIITIILRRKDIFTFFKGVIEELRKVEWLSRKDWKNFSIITIAMLVISTLMIMGVDQIFVYLRNTLILR